MNAAASGAAAASGLSKLILASTNRQSLIRSLVCPSIYWTPLLVDTILKQLWNHGPKALQFFHILLHHHPTYAHSVSSFDHAIDIAARLRNYATVFTLLHRMRSLRLHPTPKSFAIITERYVAAGKPDKALKIFLSMHQHGCFQDLHSFNTILDVLCKARRVEKAWNFFKVLRGRFQADVISYNIIANGWCSIKRTNKGLETFKEMMEKGLSPNLTTYNIILKGYFRAGQIDEGWKFFLEMKRRKIEFDVVTYTTVVHGLGVAGEIKRAQNVFNQMVDDGVLPSVATYNALIQVLCKKDSVENAVSVFESMLKKGYAPNSTTYNVVIRGLCHREQRERGMEFMDRMRDDGCGPNVQTYNIVIRYFCNAGEIERGLALFEKINSGDCLPNLDTYNVLISAMFVRKRSDDMLVAGKLLVEMVDRGFTPRRLTFNRVLDGLLLTGNQSFAKEILRLKSGCGRFSRRFKL
ncbi:Pentatricopeptide repeat-containing protein [Hibiscus syriacus]|uniref:Pentatricopeptide repeat-containing protein n=1 Tax=Hibiscus syriacus TaxID=106335 RepID=A0A6A2X827_HIBSY|nr:pentatricopeptide repeat-containing protein At1g74900, mitochondrial-like [Hibiscus syriacus]KAE8663325.1 Pentatricopeptide repeat-containing protein [Hibiscus syriacus]